MTRTMLRDALSALAAATLVTAVSGAPASAQGKSPKSYQAEVALDAVRGLRPKVPLGAAQDGVSLERKLPQQTTNGQNWRWWYDYGGGR